MFVVGVPYYLFTKPLMSWTWTTSLHVSSLLYELLLVSCAASVFAANGVVLYAVSKT